MRSAVAQALAAASLLAFGCQRPPPPRGDAPPTSSAARPSAPASAIPGDRELVLLATAELRGTPEPCGCQSDPLGDVARVAGLLRQAQAQTAGHGGALLLDAGGLRYDAEPIRPERAPQAELKAEFLEHTWQSLGVVVGLGDEDFARGREHVPATRLCANVSGPPLVAQTVRDVGGVRVGLFGVMGADLLDAARQQALGVTVSDPIEAARQAAPRLRAEGAEVVVALAHLSLPEARRLARAVPGIDVVVAGAGVDAGSEPQQVERGDGEPGAVLLQPAEQGQKVARLALHLQGGVLSTRLLPGPEARKREAASVARRIEAVEAQLVKLVADTAADPSFVSTKRAEAERLRVQRAQLDGPAPLPSGSYALGELVPIRRKLARDPALADAMKALDARIGEANRAAAEHIPVPPAPPGTAHYVGIEECELCHAKAVKQWKGTVHARAWDELRAVDKQWSYDCISCHVTGYGRPGGSAMAHVDGLQDVQCEVCHGPASKHADAPRKFKLTMPDEGTCKGCHTPEHSDTFQLQAYLRDVLGPGHGERARARLGDGPTGHELRRHAQDQARME